MLLRKILTNSAKTGKNSPTARCHNFTTFSPSRQASEFSSLSHWKQWRDIVYSEVGIHKTLSTATALLSVQMQEWLRHGWYEFIRLLTTVKALRVMYCTFMPRSLSIGSMGPVTADFVSSFSSSVCPGATDTRTINCRCGKLEMLVLSPAVASGGPTGLPGGF